MKKRIKLTMLLLLSISTVFMTGCTFDPVVTGSENTVEEELAYKDFNAIDLSHSFSAEIIQSDQYRVSITYNTNLKKYIKILKRGKTLKIGLKEDHNYRNVKLSVKIFMPDITGINASGACKIDLPKFSSENLQIELSGASTLHAGLEINNNLKINSSGASDIFLAGHAKNTDLVFSGASKLSGKGMIIINNLDIECSGASTITLTANGKISLDLSGASDVNYYGNGTVVKANTSGASSINKRGNDTL